jgi:hypothetical protein
MANPSLQIGNGKFAIKENDLLGYSSSGTRFFPIPITMTRATLGTRVNPSGLIENVELSGTVTNLARVDYTDGTGSLLVEPQRTNLFPYSEDFSNADWSKTNVSVTPNSTTSPQGTINASLIKENSANALHFISDSISVTNGNSYSVSVFAKKKERDVLQISLSTNFLAASYANYDLTTGVVSATGGLVNAEIQTLTNDWYRCKIIFTATSTQSGSPLFVVQNSTTASRNASYQGDGTSGLYLWGAQVEEGSYPTSYIKTQGATVTRNQDEYTKTGISDKINSEEGVLFVEMAALSDDSDSKRITISDGTLTNRITISIASNIISGFINVNNVTQYTFYESGITTTDFNKIAIKYKANDFSVWINGVEYDVQTSGSTFSTNTLNTLNFSNATNLSNFLFGKVKQLQVFKTALSDSELATLTTL